MVQVGLDNEHEREANREVFIPEYTEGITLLKLYLLLTQPIIRHDGSFVQIR